MAVSLRDLDRVVPGVIPDLQPEATMVKHAFSAIVEHWNIALFATWRCIAERYVADHYNGPPGLSTAGRVEREAALTEVLAKVMARVAEGDA